MNVACLVDASQKEREIVALRKTGKLSGVVQPHVHYARNPSFVECREESLRVLLRESNREDLHKTTITTNRESHNVLLGEGVPS